MPILLIRHGETPGNATRVVQTPETPLSERGQLQAARLARRLAAVGVERIVSSDLSRARMTAERTAEAAGAPLELEPLLQERNFGILRGIAYSELDRDPFAADYEPPRGESWPAFHERVDRAWQLVCRTASETPGTLAVVTHGLVCHSIVSRWVELPEPLRPGARSAAGFGDGILKFGNTSLTELEGPAPWRVVLLACTRHLDDEAPDDPGGVSGL